MEILQKYLEIVSKYVLEEFNYYYFSMRKNKTHKMLSSYLTFLHYRYDIGNPINIKRQKILNFINKYRDFYLVGNIYNAVIRAFDVNQEESFAGIIASAIDNLYKQVGYENGRRGY